MASDTLRCTGRDRHPRAIVNVIGAQVQRAHDDGVLVLTEVKDVPRLGHDETRHKDNKHRQDSSTTTQDTVNQRTVVQRGNKVKMVDLRSVVQRGAGVVAGWWLLEEADRFAPLLL